jgi:hypothetical protein
LTKWFDYSIWRLILCSCHIKIENVINENLNNTGYCFSSFLTKFFIFFKDNTSLSTEEDNIDTPTVDEPATKKVKMDPKLHLLNEAFGILKVAANRPPPQSDNNQNTELRSLISY